MKDAARALAALNGRLLRAYSRRCLRSLRPSLRLALGPLEPVLALNVEKEARKDAVAIQCADEPESAAKVTLVLQKAQAIDRDFLERVGRLPVRLEIRYDEIEPIRRRRMERLLDAAARITAAPWRGIRAGVRRAYEREEFNGALREHLRLYGAEVYALNRSVRVPALIKPLRQVIAERLRAIMDQEAPKLALDVTRLIYDRPMR